MKLLSKHKAGPETKIIKKRKAVGTSKGAKYVLFLGDEGAILIYLKNNTVQSRQFVPDASPHNLREFRQTLIRDTHAPLILVIDSMDQSYMQQTLPPVSALSVNRLIKRRLERDFGGNDIKGAILLGREKTGRKDWNFLMVALEKSPQLTLWLDFVQDMPNRFLGIHLASVESEIMLGRLEQAMGVPEGEPAEWKFFVSHNKVGGFRQVVLRGGRIMFTRLAQPVAESSAEVIAGSIEQEMLSTIEYMKRLSFSPQSKLDITIVTSSAIKAAIDKGKFNANVFHVLTPFELSQYLGIEGAAQPTDQFGDVIMAASIGSSKKHVLTMSAPQTKRIDQYYQVVLYQRMAALIAIFGILGYAGYTAYGIYGLMSDNANLRRQEDVQKQNLEALRNDIKRSNVDVEKASDLIDLYQQLLQERETPLPMVQALEPMTRASPVWIKGFDWTLVPEGKSPAPSPGAPPGAAVTLAAPKGPSMITTLTIEFPQEATDSKIFRALSKKVLMDFRNQFKGLEVKYTNVPEETENDRMEIRSVEKPDQGPKSLEVQMTIRGDWMQIVSPPPAALEAGVAGMEQNKTETITLTGNAPKTPKGKP